MCYDASGFFLENVFELANTKELRNNLSFDDLPINLGLILSILYFQYVPCLFIK